MFQKYLILIPLLAVCSCGHTQKVQNENLAFLPQLVDIVKENHLAPKAMDSQMSKDIFDSFLSKLDPEKKIFTFREIDQLKSGDYTVVEAFETGNSHFFDEVIQLRLRGMARAEAYANRFLNEEIVITEDEYVETNMDKIDFLKEPKELEKRWKLIIKRRFLKDLFFTEIAEPNSAPQEQEEAALKKTTLFFSNYFYQINSRTEKELQEIYANAYLTNIDYQSEFMFPESKARWDAKFDRTLVGVGLAIETTLNYPRISSVVFDGPAWRTKKINGGDLLMKIENDENEWIDMAGLPIKRVLELLKGTEGSMVKIMTQSTGNKIEEIEIQRGPVSLPMTMSFILTETTKNKKIGYIYLPRFYVGSEGCASHILNELEQLKKHDVEGIIFDVRDNQGGSATEAIRILGYFLNGGPVMQAKYANGNIRVFDDEDPKVQYAGKLIVLVNERSSSASELFAGTMQDYHRAIVVGNQTFGKGTIQRFIDVADERDSIKFGVVKLTRGSFYTGLGRSTQYTGVTPDIIWPSKNANKNIGERNIKNALRFEDLTPSKSITNDEHGNSLTELILLSEKRQMKNEYFIELEKANSTEKQNLEESLISLDYETYKARNNNSRHMNVNERNVENLIVVDPSLDAYEQGRKGNWKNKIERDRFIYESVLIMNDYL